MASHHLVLPAYDYVLCSHPELLDARGAISVTERTGYIARCAIWRVSWRENTWNSAKPWVTRCSRIPSCAARYWLKRRWVKP